MHVLVLHVIYHRSKHPGVMLLVCPGRCIHYILFTTASNVAAQCLLIAEGADKSVQGYSKVLQMQRRDFLDCKGQLT